jgi:hypothetical protein
MTFAVLLVSALNRKRIGNHLQLFIVDPIIIYTLVSLCGLMKSRLTEAQETNGFLCYKCEHIFGFYYKINLRTGQTQKLTRHGHNYRADWFDPQVLPVQPTKQTLTTTWTEVKKK